MTLQVEKWSVDDVVSWAVQKVGISETHAEKLRTQEIDGASLLIMTDVKFERYGIPGGPASKLADALKKLNPESPVAPIIAYKSWTEDEPVLSHGIPGGPATKLTSALKKVNPESPGSSVLTVTPQESNTQRLLEIREWWKRLSYGNLEYGNFIHFAKNYPFGGHKFIFVRYWYEILLKTIVEQKHHFVIINGNPGIGKSCFLIYLLIIMVQKGKMVFYRHFTEKKVYCFDKNDVKCYHSDYLEEIPGINDKDNWYLVDTEQNPGMIKAVTVLAVSPRPENSKLFRKYEDGIRTYYMPTWSYDELLLVNQKFSLSEDDLKSRFYRFGGIPRYLFDKTTDSQIRQESALESVNNFEVIFSCLNSSALTNNISHFIIQLNSDPEENLLRYRIDFASIHVARCLVKIFKEQDRQNFLRFLQIDDNYKLSVFRGHAFEEYAHIILSAGGTFKVRCLSKGCDTDYIKLPPRSITSFHSKFENLVIDKSVYYKPDKYNYPAVDSWTFEEGFFQMTVADTHPIKVAHLHSMIKAIQKWTKEEGSIYRLYFVVPLEKVDTFVLQQLKVKQLKVKQLKAKQSSTTPQETPTQTPSKKRKTTTPFNRSPTPKDKQTELTDYFTLSGNRVVDSKNEFIIEQWVLGISIAPDPITSPLLEQQKINF